MSSMLQPGQQVRIGDQTGKVVRHDMNTTVLETGNGLTSIPNAALAKEQVTVLNGSGQR
jgi:small-conductance mechanosensitive channel